MTPHPRYEIKEKIAAGDFAVVHKAFDHELYRDVAIKQIHDQYLDDADQLSRYWKEAMLLASLHHPHVVTIFDIVKPRGWLVLELMAANLRDYPKGEPIDLELLRRAVTHALRALVFLHSHGVIHGDIKPSNLLFDGAGVVKLGDFGLARRVHDDQGSLLRGATRYMAPETASDQFGPVGPTSDLYSLGFSAYELLCGRYFDNLFPGLGVYGRDKQMAWMMWHTTPSRRLPLIREVMEGVPPDLAAVIERLATKDVHDRYRSAEAALADLRSPGVVGARAATPSMSLQNPKSQSSTKRPALWVGGAALSALLSLILLFWTPGKRSVAGDVDAPPLTGLVRALHPQEQKIVIAEEESGVSHEIAVRSDERILLNGRLLILLRELKEGDRLSVKHEVEESGRVARRLFASRPEKASGSIKRIDLAQARVLISLSDSIDHGAELLLCLPTTCQLSINGDQPQPASRRLSELRPGDQVIAEHWEADRDRVALSLRVSQRHELTGVLRDLDRSKKTLTIDAARTSDSAAALVTLPWEDRCEVTLNGQRVLNQQLVKIDDLQVGDRVEARHHGAIESIAARRTIVVQGSLERVMADASSLEMRVAGKPLAVTVPAECSLTFAGEKAGLADVRPGDRLTLTHACLEDRRPEALSIDVVRPTDPTRRAMIVVTSAYEESAWNRKPDVDKAWRQLADRMRLRYSLSDAQLTLLENPSLNRLERELDQLSKPAGPIDQLYVTVSARAIPAPSGGVILATKEGAPHRLENAGLKLNRLLAIIEGIVAKEKILILDLACGSADGAKLASETFALGSTLRSTRVAYRLTADAAAENGLPRALADALSGNADEDRDGRCAFNELQKYWTTTGFLSDGATRFLFPNATPARLPDLAKKAIEEMLAAIERDEVNIDPVKALFDTADKEAPSQPEPKLAYALALLKAGRRTQAQPYFDEAPAFPENPTLASQGAAWVLFHRRAYAAGVERLTTMLNNMPVDSARGKDPRSISLFAWCGRLHGVAAFVSEPSRRPSPAIMQALDDAMKRHGRPAINAYQSASDEVSRTVDELARRISQAPSSSAATQIEFEKRQIKRYVHFPFSDAVQSIARSMKK